PPRHNTLIYTNHMRRAGERFGSALPEESRSPNTAALLRSLKIESADFFGHSNGGSVALQIGIRHPGLTRKPVIASAMFTRDGLYPEFWESMTRHASEHACGVEGGLPQGGAAP